MLEFSWRKKDKNNVPVMSAKEMDELAEVLINDYKPALIKEPQPINYEHFLLGQGFSRPVDPLPKGSDPTTIRQKLQESLSLFARGLFWRLRS